MRHGKLQYEQGISQHLPYVMHESPDIILTEQEDRLRFWKVTGLAVDTADPYSVHQACMQRQQLFSHLPNGNEFFVYHTFIRKKQSSPQPPKIKTKFAQKLFDDYYEKFKSNPLYENSHYLSLQHRAPYYKNKLVSHEKAKEAFQSRYEKSMKHIEEASKFIEQQLNTHGINRLTSENDCENTPLKFLSLLINFREDKPKPQPMDIRIYLPQVRISFGEKVLEIQDTITSERKFAAMLGVKGYEAKETWPGTLDDLLTLPVEIILTQSFSLLSTQEAREKMSLHQRRLLAAEDPDLKGFSQLQEAIGDVVAGDYALGHHHLAVMVISDNQEELENSVALVHQVLLKNGLISVRESMLLEPLFWSQFPGNQKYLFRNITLHSGNVACFASLHTKNTGHNKSYWGSPLLLLRTPERSSYWFNFHVGGRDVGDTLILGEKGSGKTLLLTTLASAALQYNPRIFFFDKDFGAFNWFKAVDANHSVLGVGQSSGLNPLQLPDTPGNRIFLHQWLKSLIEAFGQPLTESEEALVYKAVIHNYQDLKPNERTLSHLQSVFGVGGPGSLRNRIGHWHSGGEFAYYFDNPTDTLSFDNPVTGFEMHYLLQDSQSNARLSVLIYLFHRIRLALESGDKRPTLIILDEAWSLLSSSFFAKEINNWLLTLRKLNAITIFATQNPASVLNHSITPILVAETVTKILYKPNTPTSEVYEKALHLSQGEYQALCSIKPGSRSFLIKQPDHAAVAEIDLAEITHYIPILSTRPSSENFERNDKKILDEAKKESLLCLT